MKKSLFTLTLLFVIIIATAQKAEIKNKTVYYKGEIMLKLKANEKDPYQFMDAYTPDGEKLLTMNLPTVTACKFIDVWKQYGSYEPMSVEDFFTMLFKKEVIINGKTNLNNLMKLQSSYTVIAEPTTQKQSDEWQRQEKEREERLEKAKREGTLTTTTIYSSDNSNNSSSQSSSSSSSSNSTISFTLRNSCNNTVNYWIGNKDATPGYSSGKFSSNGSNTRVSLSGNSSQKVCLTDDSRNVLSCQNISTGTIEISSSCTSFR